MNDFDLGTMEVSNGGLDSFLGDNSELVTPANLMPKVAQERARPERIRVASLAQLSGFVRTAEDTLIHKCERDLWALRKDAGGQFFIERMFDEQGAPLKG